MNKPTVYNRLFTKILDSSIWLEPDSTRIVWVTLLASMNEDGYCHFSALENLASRAHVSIAKAKKAIACFESPDPNSENLSFEGRRLERVPGGYLVLNAKYYREKFSREIEKEQTRLRVQRHREKKAQSNDVTVTKTLHTVSPASASVSDSVFKEEKKEGTREKTHGLVDSEWIARLVNDPTYKGIDVSREFGKMTNWCRENRVEPTRRRFINWLNRADRRLDGTSKGHTTESNRNTGTANEGKSNQYKGVGKV